MSRSGEGHTRWLTPARGLGRGIVMPPPTPLPPNGSLRERNTVAGVLTGSLKGRILTEWATSDRQFPLRGTIVCVYLD